MEAAPDPSAWNNHMPFIGPNNTVGINRLTLSLDNRENVTVLDYQHSENF